MGLRRDCTSGLHARELFGVFVFFGVEVGGGAGVAGGDPTRVVGDGAVCAETVGLLGGVIGGRYFYVGALEGVAIGGGLGGVGLVICHVRLSVLVMGGGVIGDVGLRPWPKG